MEAMTIDFYEHMNRCSGKCQSRNYVNAPSEEVLQARKSKRTSEAGQLKYEIENEMAGKEADNDDNRKSTTDNSTKGSSFDMFSQYFSLKFRNNICYV